MIFHHSTVFCRHVSRNRSKSQETMSNSNYKVGIFLGGSNSMARDLFLASSYEEQSLYLPFCSRSHFHDVKASCLFCNKAHLIKASQGLSKPLARDISVVATELCILAT